MGAFLVRPPGRAGLPLLPGGQRPHAPLRPARLGIREVLLLLIVGLGLRSHADAALARSRARLLYPLATPASRVPALEASLRPLSSRRGCVRPARERADCGGSARFWRGDSAKLQARGWELPGLRRISGAPRSNLCVSKTLLAPAPGSRATCRMPQHRWPRRTRPKPKVMVRNFVYQWP